MEFVDIETINTNNKYLRLETDISKLKKSIETVGIINPLVINENNKLIAGGRRYSALKELGINPVPVIKISKNEYEEELISIDENLVRKDLTNMEVEKTLSRGRELYEMLYPEALKYENEDLTVPEYQDIQSELPNDKRSFIDLTAEKTGLSKRVIKSAIEREEKASDKVKELRSLGELNATQTNELIKLDKDDQEKLSDLVHKKSAKDIKNIVKKVKEQGVEATVNEILTTPTLPTEFKSFETLLKRMNKVLGKIIFEDIRADTPEVKKILEGVSTLRINLDQLVESFANPSPKLNAMKSEDFEEDDETNAEAQDTL
ncbi:MAG: hypothetical protein CME62_14580 [Halobacteriovoraceae bacterium]|nr:hypothetical protein [Halobacteriovoraceae bacterium]|tara:strand:+ start:14019 stop:14972 length:954 start_codon:yes stop_codon:yes gene_type:complete